MIKGFFISQWSNNEQGYYPGPAKKINGQIEAFRSYGMDISFVGRSNGVKNEKVPAFRRIFMQVYSRLPFTPVLKEPDYSPVRVPNIKKVVNADFIYIRYWWGDWPFSKMIYKIRRQNPKAIIFLELPDYPYLQKVVGWKNYYMIAKDKCCTRKLKNNVDYVVTMDGAKTVFGIPGIHIYNGIEVEKYPVRTPKVYKESTINIGFVASAKYSHGLDRLINGMKDYYNKDNRKYDVHLHLVGGGIAMNSFVECAQNAGVDSHITYYGYKYGEELDRIYDMIDMAIDYLALHRENFHKSSSLKSREYLARGIPIIAAGSVDICEDNGFEHILTFDETDEPIDIDRIVDFYEREYKNGYISVINDIREFAKKNVDMKVTLKPVIDTLIEKNIYIERGDKI